MRILEVKMEKQEQSWTKNRTEWESRYCSWCKNLGLRPCELKNLTRFATECGGVK